MSPTNKRLAALFNNHTSITGALEGIFSKNKHFEHLYVDAFARIPALNAAILCTSSHDSRPVNRVIYSLSQNLMKRISKITKRGVTLSAEDANDLTPVHPLDIAARLTLSNNGEMRYYPIIVEGEVAGYCRFAGNNLKKHKIYLDRILAELEEFTAKPVPLECDMTAIPHLIGRTYGERLCGLTCKHLGENQIAEIRNLLAIPQSICKSGSAMMFLRDFEDDSMRCIAAVPEMVESKLQDIRSLIKSDHHMFTLIARCGMSLRCANFPQDIELGDHKAFARWRPDRLYKTISRNIPEPRSYIGIPIRVDDNVIGVFQLLAHFGDDTMGLSELYSFMRSVISEFGRTLDKQRTTHACHILMAQSVNPPPLANENAGERFATHFFQPLLEQVWPHDRFTVSFFPAINNLLHLRINHDFKKVLSVPELAEILAHALHKRDLVLREAFTTDSARKGILAIPLFSHEAETNGDIGCIVILGNIATLSSRSVTNVAQYLIAIGTAAWSENIARMLGQEILKSERAIRKDYDDLWSTVHDLKASLSEIYNRKNTISTLITNPDIKSDALRPLLRTHVDAWFASITHVLQLMSEATDKSRLQEIKRVSLLNVVTSALQDALTIVNVSCLPKIYGDAFVHTSEYELKRALTEVFINSAQALGKLDTDLPAIDIRITSRAVPNKPVAIFIQDNAFCEGRVSVVRKALYNPKQTLCKFVRARCSRLLDIDVTVSGSDKLMTIAFHLPLELNPR